MTMPRTALAALILLAGLSIGSGTADASDLKANEAAAYKSIQLWMSGTKLTPEEVMAPGYVNHVDSAIAQTGAAQKRDLAKLKADLTKFRAAFSDVRVTSKVQVAQGDMVATRVVISAKHTGSFLGEKPTDKTVIYDSVEFSRIEKGKIAETWVTWDKWGLYKQIGLLPK